jgi:hypothetical protein
MIVGDSDLSVFRDWDLDLERERGAMATSVLLVRSAPPPVGGGGSIETIDS